MKDSLEVFGSLTKVEELTPIEENIIPGTLVFDSVSPFFGYYNDDPLDLSPIYIYIATERTYSVFEILRAFGKVKEELDIDFDVAKAFANFNDKMINVIRVRHIDDYEKVKDIQHSFFKNGIHLLPCSVHCKKVSATVTINKNFKIKKISDNIFIDSLEKNHFYFKLPVYLEFNDFIEISEKVRNNWFDNKFDAALGCYIRKQKVIDFARIYSENHEIDNLEKLRKLFLQKIGR